jgi:hypothetical protein
LALVVVRLSLVACRLSAIAAVDQSTIASRAGAKGASQIQAVVSGFANGTSCASCTSMNGTFFLSYNGSAFTGFTNGDGNASYRCAWTYGGAPFTFPPGLCSRYLQFYFQLYYDTVANKSAYGFLVINTNPAAELEIYGAFSYLQNVPWQPSLGQVDVSGQMSCSSGASIATLTNRYATTGTGQCNISSAQVVLSWV